MALLPRKKRFLIAIPLGIVAGVLCTWFSSFSVPEIWGTAMMWTIITNRFIIGLIVGLAGVYTTHPIFDFRLPSYLRGFCLGVFVSLSLAAGAMITPSTTWTIFGLTLLMGGIYGSIIDMIATRWGGEGKDLLN